MLTTLTKIAAFIYNDFINDPATIWRPLVVSSSINSSTRANDSGGRTGFVLNTRPT